MSLPRVLFLALATIGVLYLAIIYPRAYFAQQQALVPRIEFADPAGTDTKTWVFRERVPKPSPDICEVDSFQRDASDVSIVLGSTGPCELNVLNHPVFIPVDQWLAGWQCSGISPTGRVQMTVTAVTTKPFCTFELAAIKGEVVIIHADAVIGFEHRAAPSLTQ